MFLYCTRMTFKYTYISNRLNPNQKQCETCNSMDAYFTVGMIIMVCTKRILFIYLA